MTVNNNQTIVGIYSFFEIEPDVQLNFPYLFIPAFRSNDKPLKKKFKKSVTKATENGATNIVENEEDQVVSIEGQLTTKPVLSKRQKKKLRKLQHTDRSKDKEAEKVIAYLVKWNEDRDEWKYEKLKQIFIQKNVYDGDIITDEHSDIAINYLTTSKV